MNGAPQFTELQYFLDQDLVELLKMVPNTVLLSALHDRKDEGVLQRICEALSLTGAKYLVEDLEISRKNTDINPDRIKSQKWIMETAAQMHADGIIAGAQPLPPVKIVN